MNPSHPILGFPPKKIENGVATTAEETSIAGLFFMTPKADSEIANRIAGQPNT